VLLCKEDADCFHEGLVMAATLGRRIAKVVNEAMAERDRAEMRAVDVLISAIAPRRRSAARRKRASKRRRR